MTRLGIAALVAAALLWSARSAEAFCGFYVSPGEGQLLADATQVVLMRKGTRTVLSMQNNYKGPPSAFAMVIPVPVVLKEGDVKTLPKSVFENVERMGAPRLVEYWEQDPCYEPPMDEEFGATGMAMSAPRGRAAGVGSTKDLGVTIEAQFAVGEYKILILSARDSTGLDTWLRREKYNIPAGAAPLLRPYVEGGMKFFVAKVDTAKVKFDANGRADLSPLRFHYDSTDFVLPIRLGLANSSGTQDLIVNILAPSQRYEVANYKNVTIPTNLEVTADVKGKFGAFYAALFDRTLERHPGSVVTEYAWQATSCDPCPGPVLDASDFTLLGADVLDGSQQQIATDTAPPAGGQLGPANPRTQLGQGNRRRSVPRWLGSDMTLTRLHARYGKDLKDDLVFKAAPPIVGGREHVVDYKTHKLEEGAVASSFNNFQGRYAIRYPWTGPIKCKDPQRGRWGGPPNGGSPPPKPALDLAFAPRGGVQLAAALVPTEVPEIGLTKGVLEAIVPGSAPPVETPPPATAPVTPPVTPPATAPVTPPTPPVTPPAAPAIKKSTGGCGCGTSGSGGSLLGFVVGALLIRRRRRR